VLVLPFLLPALLLRLDLVQAVLGIVGMMGTVHSAHIVDKVLVVGIGFQMIRPPQVSVWKNQQPYLPDYSWKPLAKLQRILP